MFNNGLKLEIKILNYKLKELENEIWNMKNPYGKVVKDLHGGLYGFFYKPDKYNEIKLCHVLHTFISEIKYKIKKVNDVTHVVLTFIKPNLDEDIRVFMIQDNNCIEVNSKALNLEDYLKEFDLEKTL